MKFKEEYTYEQRKAESNRVFLKYPDRIPIICEKSKNSKLNEMDKKKYLVPCDLTCGQFVFVIRKRLTLPAEKGIFLFINGSIPCSSEYMSEIYKRNMDLDGFLYVTYSEENVFG
jgi:GABA(A) receptor-associated protein